MNFLKTKWIVASLLLFPALANLGCAHLVRKDLKSTKGDHSNHLPASHFEKNWGWTKPEGSRPGVYQVGKHRISFALGTTFAVVDGKSLNLKAPIYSLNNEIYVPRRFQKLCGYLKKANTNQYPTSKESEGKKTADSPTSNHPPYLKAEEREGKKNSRSYVTYYKKDKNQSQLPATLNLPRRHWKYIVIHHSSTTRGDADSFHRYHKNRRHWKNGLGYHFVIGNGSLSKEGEIEIGPRWKKQQAGAHAGSTHYNRYGIGICLVGNFQNGKPSLAQMRSLVELTRTLMTRYEIPLKRVLPHHEVRQGPTSCPGKNFPWKIFKRELALYQ